MVLNITGRLTRDAVVRTTSQNKEVVSFSIAQNDSYRNKSGERVEQTTFFDCSYWISSKVAKLLTKGSIVELTGRVSARALKGSDGEARAALNLNASQIKLHGGSRRTETELGSEKSVGSGLTTPEAAEDLPF